jgi:hypothetical protein
MNEQELRALIRESIAKHLGEGAPRVSAGTADSSPGFREHASHGLLPLARGGDGDGACLIEPSVRCNHCGYCLSYGH